MAVANVYAQDLPVTGFTSEVTVVYNRNREAGDIHYDSNGFPVAPGAARHDRARNYDVVYLGYNGDGHFGRFNLTASVITRWARTATASSPASRPTSRSYFVAAELSLDFDWIRVRLSLLYASGDDNPYDNKATGFDAIFENPQFAGADTSYWIRQAIPFVGGGRAVFLTAATACSTTCAPPRKRASRTSTIRAPSCWARAATSTCCRSCALSRQRQSFLVRRHHRGAGAAAGGLHPQRSWLGHIAGADLSPLADAEYRAQGFGRGAVAGRRLWRPVHQFQP